MISHPDTDTVVLDARYHENLRFAERQRLAATAIETAPISRRPAAGAQLVAALRHLGQRFGGVRTEAPAPLLPLASGES